MTRERNSKDVVRAYVLDKASTVFTGSDEGFYFANGDNEILRLERHMVPSQYGRISAHFTSSFDDYALFPAGTRVMLTLPKIDQAGNECGPSVISAIVKSSRELSITSWSRLIGDFRRAKDRGEKPSLVQLLGAQ